MLEPSAVTDSDVARQGCGSSSHLDQMARTRRETGPQVIYEITPRTRSGLAALAAAVSTSSSPPLQHLAPGHAAAADGGTSAAAAAAAAAVVVRLGAHPLHGNEIACGDEAVVRGGRFCLRQPTVGFDSGARLPTVGVEARAHSSGRDNTAVEATTTGATTTATAGVEATAAAAVSPDATPYPRMAVQRNLQPGDSRHAFIGAPLGHALAATAATNPAATAAPTVPSPITISATIATTKVPADDGTPAATTTCAAAAATVAKVQFAAMLAEVCPETYRFEELSVADAASARRWRREATVGTWHTDAQRERHMFGRRLKQLAQALEDRRVGQPGRNAPQCVEHGSSSYRSTHNPTAFAQRTTSSVSLHCCPDFPTFSVHCSPDSGTWSEDDGSCPSDLSDWSDEEFDDDCSVDGDLDVCFSNE
jgi:hypothetical protein